MNTVFGIESLIVQLKSRLKLLSDKKSIIHSQNGLISPNSAALLSLKEGFQSFKTDLSKLQVK